MASDSKHTYSPSFSTGTRPRGLSASISWDLCSCLENCSRWLTYGRRLYSSASSTRHAYGLPLPQKTSIAIVASPEVVLAIVTTTPWRRKCVHADHTDRTCGAQGAPRRSGLGDRRLSFRPCPSRVGRAGIRRLPHPALALRPPRSGSFGSAHGRHRPPPAAAGRGARG